MATAKKVQDIEQTDSALMPVDLGGDYLALQYDVADLHEMIRDCLEGGLQESDLEQIRLPTGGRIKWELPSSSGGEEVATFDGVIVGVQTTRAYWPVAFGSGTTAPPDCTSRDGKTGTGSPGGECEWCPKNQWGSGKNGMGTACAERKRVYILRPEGLLPVVLNLPVMSINNLRKYQVRLVSQRTPVNVVVTRFALESTRNKGNVLYSQATFTSVGPLPASLAPLAKAYAKTIQAAVGIHTESPARVGPSEFVSSDPTQVDADGIPESDPPFGPFAKQQVRPKRMEPGPSSTPSLSETDEIPFIRSDMWTELSGTVTKKVL